MEAWTRRVIRHRKKVLAAWLVLFVLGGLGAANVGKLLSNRFSVPGSDAERGLDLLKDRFNERGDGAFTLVFKTDRPIANTRAFRLRAARTAHEAAGAVSGARPGPVLPASRDVAYVEINTPLENADAADKTQAVRDATPSVPGATTYLSGYPAINHDTQKIYNDDLKRGESIAIPIALIVLAFMFGTLVAIGVPFAFAAMTIPPTLGAVWIFAHFMDMAVYVTNIVTLIGFAIAIDYSMLVVFRYREELSADRIRDRGARDHDANGRARHPVLGRPPSRSASPCSCSCPFPSCSRWGSEGCLVPLFSIFASATFLPALLAVLGRKINRFRVIPKRVLAVSCRGPAGLLDPPVPLDHEAAGPLSRRRRRADDRPRDPGLPASPDGRRQPRHPPDDGGDRAGWRCSRARSARARWRPTRSRSTRTRRAGPPGPPTVAAERRLVVALKHDPEVDPSTIQAPVLAGPGPAGVAKAQRASLIDSERQVIQIRAAARSDAGTTQAADLVHRIRDNYVPASGFQSSTTVLVTGAPAFGVDFIDTAYAAFPWLVAAVLVLSYLLLLRAFRSVVLPLKAVLMNLLSVAATYGVLVLVFEHGLHSVLGLHPSSQIEAWIPIFLFAMLFGLSMDYEVFLLSRMREEWDLHHDNERAVSSGLEHTGRIITAAAIIMIAAFSGFTSGSFVGLQEFGIGLSAAILFDATVVRALLVPALMKLLGRLELVPAGARAAGDAPGAT